MNWAKKKKTGSVLCEMCASNLAGSVLCEMCASNLAGMSLKRPLYCITIYDVFCASSRQHKVFRRSIDIPADNSVCIAISAAVLELQLGALAKKTGAKRPVPDIL